VAIGGVGPSSKANALFALVVLVWQCCLWF
jgi:hypothetical protein